MNNLPMSSFAYLDQISFRSIFADGESSHQMKFYIEGMRCSKCVNRIEGLVHKNSEIQDIRVDLGNNTALVELRSKKNSFGEVARQIEELGFKVVPVPWQKDGLDEWKNESKSALLRIGIAGFLAANIMTLALATYFGDVGSLRAYFFWTQFFLYLPVVTYVAFPFYQGFLAGIRNHSLTIDGPMAVASFTGFIVSFYNLLQGRDTIYFDSLSSFLFLILLTRYWQKSVRHKYLQYLKPSALVETFKARIVRGQNWVWVPTRDLKSKDVILVESGEWIPVDGKLLDEAARFDLSVLNGEAYAHKLYRGAPVKAGSKLISENVHIEVEAVGEKTTLGTILSSLNFQTMRDLESVKISDVASQLLLLTVFVIAAVALGHGYYMGSFMDYFERAFALIVIACPCAMAFGTPLVYSFAMKKAQAAGVLIKQLGFFDQLLEVKRVFLDKTGTLTDGQWVISEETFVEDSERQLYQEIILKLEAKSAHPIAIALRNLWQNLNFKNDVVLTDIREKQGLGVFGMQDKIRWSFCGTQIGNSKRFALYKDDKIMWSFSLLAEVLPLTIDAVSFLKQHNISVAIVSGDTQQETCRVGKLVGVDQGQCFYGVSPEGKRDLIAKNPLCLMIGDGYNDVLALKDAFLSIAARGGVDSALKSADAFFIKGGLDKIQALYAIALKSRKQIRINLAFALIYNSIGAILALLGMINPFIAAILMPISSSIILLATWWGMR